MEVCSVVDLIVCEVVIASDLVCFVGNVLTCVVYSVGCVVLVGWVSRCIKGYSRGFNILIKIFTLSTKIVNSHGSKRMNSRKSINWMCVSELNKKNVLI